MKTFYYSYPRSAEPIALPDKPDDPPQVNTFSELTPFPVLAAHRSEPLIKVSDPSFKDIKIEFK